MTDETTTTEPCPTEVNDDGVCFVPDGPPWIECDQGAGLWASSYDTDAVCVTEQPCVDGTTLWTFQTCRTPPVATPPADPGITRGTWVEVGQPTTFELPETGGEVTMLAVGVLLVAVGVTLRRSTRR